MSDSTTDRPQYQITVSVPADLPSAQLDSLSGLIANTVHNVWEPNPRDGWDADVSGRVVPGTPAAPETADRRCDYQHAKAIHDLLARAFAAEEERDELAWQVEDWKCRARDAGTPAATPPGDAVARVDAALRDASDEYRQVRDGKWSTHLARAAVAALSPAPTTALDADELMCRLAAADVLWGREQGDPCADPRYIIFLAVQALAFAPRLSPAPGNEPVGACTCRRYTTVDCPTHGWANERASSVTQEGGTQ